MVLYVVLTISGEFRVFLITLDLQPYIHEELEANGIIQRIHKDVNDMVRSFDLENNHENLETQEDNPFDYFLQSTACLPGY
jgi:hypothetical protein